MRGARAKRSRRPAVPCGRGVLRAAQAVVCVALGALLLAGCASLDAGRTAPFSVAERPSDFPPPALSRSAVDRSNAEMVDDLIDLAFQLESGRKVDRLVRLEQPIAVTLSTPGFEGHRAFLETFLADIRRETGVRVALAGHPAVAEPASRIALHMAPGVEMRASYPGLLCFFLPEAPPWSHIRNSTATVAPWGADPAPAAIGVYIPVDIAAHRVRGCLLEEITQALGPSNDLDRLQSSIFNDDDAHIWPTPFDLLMVQALNDPTLKPGMREAEARRIARGVLARLNPAGEGRSAPGPLEDRRDIADAWEMAFDPRMGVTDRLKALDAAVVLARSLPDRDYRRLSLVQARAEVRQEPDRAITELQRVMAEFERPPLSDPLRAAIAAFALTGKLAEDERWREAAQLALETAPVMARYGREANVALLLCRAARAEHRLGRTVAAHAHRDRCKAWAAYAFGADHSVMDNFR